MKSILKWLLIVIPVVYCGLVAGLYFGQQRMMYPASTLRTAPADAGLPNAEEVVLTTADGERVIAWHVPPVGEKPVVIFFHGNGDTLAGRARRFRELTASGVGLIAVSFRGYAGSTGHPTEQGLRADGAAAYAFAVAHYRSSRIALWGFSLGTGIAVGLASEQTVAQLILEAPYTSAVEVAADLFPIVPVRLLMADELRSDQRIGAVKAPILIMHGARDQAIAISYGERLFAMAPPPKRFVRFPEGRHEDLEDYGVVATVLGFLDELRR
jgi:fermentation-respiration switch protein FrsA (DUF1100 family)